MPKALDAFWEWGTPTDPNNRQSLSCNLCGQHMTGGISRLKWHIARIPVHDVGPCKNSTPELIQMAIKSLEAFEEKKKYKAALK